MVSATLGGVGLRAVTWWTKPEIPSTTSASTISCWDPSLGIAGAVEIATEGSWEGQLFDLKGGLGADRNHAKIAVSTTDTRRLADVRRSESARSAFRQLRQQPERSRWTFLCCRECNPRRQRKRPHYEQHSPGERNSAASLGTGRVAFYFGSSTFNTELTFYPGLFTFDEVTTN